MLFTVLFGLAPRWLLDWWGIKLGTEVSGCVVIKAPDLFCGFILRSVSLSG